MAYLAHVRVKALEPLSELFVLIRIVDQGVGSVEDDIHALPIGKALEESSEFGCSGFDTAVLREV